MGEQGSYYSSNSTIFVMMRNSRGKLFVYVAVLGVLCFIVFLLSSTHTSMKELEGVNEKCQQQRDSLSAQLQVVYEHKNRLEKSLQQEKNDHKHSKEANEKQVSDLESKFQTEKDEKQKIESKLSQLKKSYTDLEDEKAQLENDLKQQIKTTQIQNDGEIKKLQAHIGDLLAEKEKLEASNNALSWKLEQHASEINLCRLQLQQSNSELHTCKEQMKMHNVNAHVADKPLVAEQKASSQAPPLNVEDKPQLNDIAVLPLKTPQLPGENDILPMENQHVKDNIINITASPPKVSVFDKPRIMPSNHNGEGVLPKPLSLKPDEQIKDIDNAGEVDESNKIMKEPLLNNIVDRYADMHNHLNSPVGANLHQKEQDNHPQVAAPNFENVEDKDDHAAERDVDGNMTKAENATTKVGSTKTKVESKKAKVENKKTQVESPQTKVESPKTKVESPKKKVESPKYNPDAKPQVEEPVLGRQSPAHKEPFPAQENNDIAAQMNDMMNKSPGNINNAQDQNVLRLPPHVETKNAKDQHEFKNEAAFMHRGADVHRVIDEKNYEEDDDDRDNDDEPLNGLAPAMKGVNNILQDNDFDDQENQDNADNAKEEEGVVVAPK